MAYRAVLNISDPNEKFLNGRLKFLNATTGHRKQAHRIQGLLVLLKHTATSELLRSQRDQGAVLQIKKSPRSDLLQIPGEDNQMPNSLNFLQPRGEAKNCICSFQKGKRRDSEMSCPGLSEGFRLWEFRGRCLLHPAELGSQPEGRRLAQSIVPTALTLAVYKRR